MQKVIAYVKKEAMLFVSLAAALISLFITPPSAELLSDIDWKTLAILFMMLTVLEGFKKENIFRPLLSLSSRFQNMTGLSLFLVFGVFFTSMFVTNDVSLIIFVPLTILLFRAADREKYILPVISMENIAAIRGSLLMPFGSPQNLFLFGQSGVSAGTFILHMLPLCVLSGALLVLYVWIMYKNAPDRMITVTAEKVTEDWDPKRKKQRVLYLALFVLVVFTVVSRTTLWPYIALAVTAALLIADRKVFLKTDYVLLATFLCFFVFSSSITRNEAVSGFLSRTVAGHEYLWGILLSQGISNVPAAIVLYPFTENLAALLNGVDTAGLCSLIGSLASVINYRIYVREYPAKGKKFILVFTGISLIFFVVVAVPGYLLSFWRF